jgi:hypothetical protein
MSGLWSIDTDRQVFLLLLISDVIALCFVYLTFECPQIVVEVANYCTVKYDLG